MLLLASLALPAHPRSEPSVLDADVPLRRGDKLREHAQPWHWPWESANTTEGQQWSWDKVSLSPSPGVVLKKSRTGFGQVVYTDEEGSRSLAMCACAKCGTTSIYQWLYESINGRSWEDDKKSVTKLADNLDKIEKLHGADIHRIASWPAPPQGSVSQNAPYDPATTTVIAVYRDPLDRYRSAWEGKLRCATRSENAEHFITQLLEQAGLPTSYGEVPRDPAHPLPKHFEDLDPEVAWCMSFEDFALALRRIHASGKQGELNEHFYPQGPFQASSFGRFEKGQRVAPDDETFCAAGDVNKMTIPELAGQVSAISDLHQLHRAAFPHEQSSSERQGDAAFKMETVSDATLAKELCAIVQPEYRWVEQDDTFREKCSFDYETGTEEPQEQQQQEQQQETEEEQEEADPTTARRSASDLEEEMKEEMEKAMQEGLSKAEKKQAMTKARNLARKLQKWETKEAAEAKRAEEAPRVKPALMWFARKLARWETKEAHEARREKAAQRLKPALI